MLQATFNRISRHLASSMNPFRQSTALQTRFRGPPTRHYCSPAEEGEEDQQLEEKPKLFVKQALQLGGDLNNVTLLGTIQQIEIRENLDDSKLKKRWAVLSIRTINRWLSSSGYKSRFIFHRAHIFNTELLQLAEMLSAGDRIYLSGSLNYFSYTSGAISRRISCVVADRLIPMLEPEEENEDSADSENIPE